MAARRTIVVVQRRSFGQRALVLSVAVAFLLQSLVTQTHIHGAAVPEDLGFGSLLAKIGAADELGEVAKSPKQAPAHDDSSRCPLCQAAQSAGAFVAPAALVLVLPWQNISFVPLFLSAGSYFDTPSHSWRGRAPPKV
jgi:hypothetical protein